MGYSHGWTREKNYEMSTHTTISKLNCSENMVSIDDCSYNVKEDNSGQLCDLLSVFCSVVPHSGNKIWLYQYIQLIYTDAYSQLFTTFFYTKVTKCLKHFVLCICIYYCFSYHGQSTFWSCSSYLWRTYL